MADYLIQPYRTSTSPTLGQGFERYAVEEFRKVENTLRTIEEGLPQVHTQPPKKPRRGVTVYAADPWNPGQGEGLYVYKGSTLGWVFIA